MISGLRKLLERYHEIVMYVIFGVATTLVNWLSYSLLMRGTQLPLAVNNAIAWLISVIFAYFTNKLWVFESKIWKGSTIIKELGLFFGARILSGVFEMIAVPALVYFGIDQTLFGVEGFLAKILTSVVVVVLNYVFSKLMIFRKNEK